MQAMRCLAYADCFGRRLVASLAFRSAARCSSCWSSCVLARGFRRSGDLLSIEPFCLQARLSFRAPLMASLSSVERSSALSLTAKFDWSCPESVDSQSVACACSTVLDIATHVSILPTLLVCESTCLVALRGSCPRRGQSTCAHDMSAKHAVHALRSLIERQTSLVPATDPYKSITVE